jgi:hypothetical protein
MPEIDRKHDPTYLYSRTLPDGRVLDVVRLTFGRARIILSASADSLFWSDGW